MVYDTAIRTGDYVEWDKPIFTGGRFYNGRYQGGAKFSHKERYSGIVIKHSYGEKTGQHTFTILLDNQEKVLVKGRNLYPNLVKHIPDENSPDRSDNGKILLK